MSFRFLSPRWYLGMAALLLCGCVVNNAQAAGTPRGRRINEFVEPRSDEVTTNLHQLTDKKDGLKQLEEDLYRPLQSFAPQSSLDGVVARPPLPRAEPAIQSKRVKELLERRKNWVFMTPEDLLAAPTVDEILKTPQIQHESKEKEDLSAVERYYQRLAAKQPEVNTPVQLDDKNQPDSPKEVITGEQRDLKDEFNLPSGIRETAEALNKLLDPANSDNPFAFASKRIDFADTFGLVSDLPSKEETQQRDKFMNEYHKLVDPSWRPPTVANPGNARSVLPDLTAPPAEPAVSTPSPASAAPRSVFDVQMDVVDPRIGPANLPDVNAQALGQTRPTPVSPKVESPRVMPGAPSFTAPKRAFR